MINYDGLPVYKSSYDLLIQIFEIVKKFEREYKYTLGESIKNKCIKIITLIYRANSSQIKRKNYLIEARESIEVLRLYIRLCKDLKTITLDKFIKIKFHWNQFQNSLQLGIKLLFKNIAQSLVFYET